MTPEEVRQRVQEIWGRAEKTSPGPWNWLGAGNHSLNDHMFFAHAPSDVLWLCGQVVRQQVVIVRLQAELTTHRGQEVEDTCYFCAKADGGPAFEMGGKIAHVACVVRRINEILPLYEGTGEPEKIVIMIRRGESHDRTKE